MKYLFFALLLFSFPAFAQKVATEVELAGTASDPDGEITRIQWTQVSGPASPKIETPDKLITKVTGFNTPGVYVYQLQVWDNDGATATSTTKVTVLPANRPPVAQAASEIIIKLPK